MSHVHKNDQSNECSPEKFPSLPFSEQLVIWGMRLWVQGHKADTCVLHMLDEGFTRVDAASAPKALDHLMTILATGAINTIDMRCPTCQNISPDEHRMLGVLAAWQSTGIGDSHHTLLSKILQPAATRAAREPAFELAMALKFAGLLIRPRREAACATLDAFVRDPKTLH